MDLAGVACPLPPNNQSGATPASRLATSPGPPLSTLPFRSLSMRACSRCRSRSSSPSSASLKIFPIALRGLLMIEPAPPPGLPLASPPPPPSVRWMNRLVSSAIVAVLGSFSATAVSSPGCDGVDGRFCCRERDLVGCAVGVRGGVVEWTRPTYSSFSSSGEAPSSWIAFSTFLWRVMVIVSTRRWLEKTAPHASNCSWVIQDNDVWSMVSMNETAPDYAYVDQSSVFESPD